MYFHLKKNSSNLCPHSRPWQPCLPCARLTRAHHHRVLHTNILGSPRLSPPPRPYSTRPTFVAPPAPRLPRSSPTPKLCSTHRGGNRSFSYIVKYQIFDQIVDQLRLFDQKKDLFPPLSTQPTSADIPALASPEFTTEAILHRAILDSSAFPMLTSPEPTNKVVLCTAILCSTACPALALLEPTTTEAILHTDILGSPACPTLASP